MLKGHKITAWRWITEKDDKNITPKKYMCMYHLILYKSWFETKLKWVSEGKMQRKL